jgi:hypothetical protein
MTETNLLSKPHESSNPEMVQPFPLEFVPLGEEPAVERIQNSLLGNPHLFWDTIQELIDTRILSPWKLKRNTVHPFWTRYNLRGHARTMVCDEVAPGQVCYFWSTGSTEDGTYAHGSAITKQQAMAGCDEALRKQGWILL